MGKVLLPDGTYDFVSDEASKSKTEKKMIAIKPSPVPTDIKNPYQVLDQKATKVKILIQDYSGSETLKVEANIEYDELLLIKEAAKNGKMGFLKDWDLGAQAKIFGNPIPKRNGKRIVHAIKVARQDKTPSGEVKNYPWYIEIRNGVATGVVGKNGGISIQKGTFEEDQKIYINLTDRDLFKMCTWADETMKIFFNAAHKTVVQGYGLIKAEKERVRQEKMAGTQ